MSGNSKQLTFQGPPLSPSSDG